jgi:anti-anti-sigma factor
MDCTELPLATPDRGVVEFTGRDDDHVVLTFRGEHDLATAGAIAEALARAITLDSADLVVDLSGVEFFGVEPVRVLIRAQHLLQARSRSLVIRSPSKSASRTIKLCGLDVLLQRHAAVTSATALGSWVAVPRSDRVDRSDAAPVPAVRARARYGGP